MKNGPILNGLGPIGANAWSGSYPPSVFAC